MKSITLVTAALSLLPASALAAPQPADSLGCVIEAGETFLEPLQQRDSILIADQLEYGFVLQDVPEGTQLGLQDFKDTLMHEVYIVRPWQLDTLLDGRPALSRKARKAMLKASSHDIRASLVIAPFEEGLYYLPPLATQRLTPGGTLDTLVFSPQQMDVRTIPVDTTTFEIHDIKGQIRYPVTFAEVLPWLLASLLLAGLIVAAVFFVRAWRKRHQADAPEFREPAYIVALRTLERYRSEKYWAPDKQKQLYSGITDALRLYIDDRFGIDACEMTTAEIFDALRTEGELPEDLRKELQDLFEVADFVKFAKHTASDEENARAIPTAVRFVTSTFRSDEQPQSGQEADGSAQEQ